MRILHVITGLGRGGAETALFRLVSRSTDVEHEVICLEQPEWYSAKLESRGVRVHHVSWSEIGLPRAVVRLHQLVRSMDADLVQTWMYRANLFGGLSSRIAGKPVVWNIRCSSWDVLPMRTRALVRAGGILARWIPKTVINCSSVSAGLHGRVGYDSVPSAVIPNGYDAKLFFPDEAARAAVRQELNLNCRTFVLATIARWHPQKGLPELIRAMRLLKDRDVPAILLMIGSELDQQNVELAELVGRSGCAEMIRLIGGREDIARIARAPDLHVLASIGAEGFPNAVAETMLSGTPNVVTDVGDSKLIVGDLGWVVPPRRPDQLAGAIEQAYEEWSTSPEQWGSRRAASRQRIADNFPIERMVETYEKLWKQIADDRLVRRRVA